MVTQTTLSIQADGTETRVEVRQLWNLPSNSRYLAYFIPKCSNLIEIIRTLLANLQFGLENHLGMKVHTHGVDQDLKQGWLDSSTLIFSGRVFLYVEEELMDYNLVEAMDNAKLRGLSLVYRGPYYASERTASEKPLAFISHDSRDKEALARPLASQLQNMKCSVWYDEFSLKIGDSLRESIETGLKECRRCILILSPNFLSNTGWTKTEFNSIFTREIIERTSVVLPIWHGVTVKNVYNYSPALADKVGVNWEQGLDFVTNQLLKVLIP